MPTNPQLLLRITPAAKKAVVAEATARGMDQKVVASRVLEWFGSRDRAIRSLILQQLTHDEVPDLEAIALKAFTPTRHR